jgi:hypothetical protein
MTKKNMLFADLILASGVAIASMLLPAFKTGAQEKPKPETIQATAMGQLQASGRTFHITINIESYSTPSDQKILIDAFQSGGHDALVKALSKMTPRGRVAITGTVGYQIAYIRTIPSENGRTIRLITDRPVQFAEAYGSTRSKDYDLSGIEMNIAKEQKQSDGSLIVAGKFKVDKSQQIVFESYGSGPWRLVNIMERN